MTPREITLALGGAWSRGRGSAPCPVNGHGKGRGDARPSLSIAHGNQVGLLLHCHGGCPSSAVFAAIRDRGLLSPQSVSTRDTAPMAPSPSRAELVAQQIWADGQPLGVSPAIRYLEKRGLSPESTALRFLPQAWHSNARAHFPALLASISNAEGRVVAIQRTFLTANGDKASVDPVRMSIGSFGSAAVRLTRAEPTMGVAEGVETALSASLLFDVPTWAVCGRRLDKVALPAAVCRVIVFADHDGPGTDAALAAARRFRREGREVEIVRPRAVGADWNDVLLTKGGVGHDTVA